jgi:PST family polysaccharide transporter
MLRFGGNMTLYSFFTYFARNLDNVLIGKVWGDAALGLYDRAYKLMLLPLVFVNAPLQRLVLPILTRTRDEASRYRSVYTTALQTALAITMPLVIMLIINADRVIALVLGPSWSEAAAIFHWLSLASLMQLVTTTAGWLYISQGRAFHMMVAGAGSSLVACVAFAIGISWGPTGVACAYAIGEVLKAPVLLWWVTREGPFRARDAAECLWPFLIAGVCCYAGASLLSRFLPGHDVLTIAALTAASYVFLLGGLLMTGAGRASLSRAQQLIQSGTGLVTRRLRPSQAL